ncbi:ArsR/SmtB family transcription factor [Streptomyces sp. 8N616]|uniref:ArsR/SmtB family transcription factor n=1 Tax=Streptomyces sp. 8N616 TaxID=3457414 RepID=UPI003FD67247
MEAVQVVAEPRRREILRLVWEAELSAGEIAGRFDVTFGAVSQHLKVLRDAGLVTLRQEGRKRFYRADRDGMGPLADYLQAMWTSKLDVLADLAEHAEHAENAENAENGENAGQEQGAHGEKSDQAGQAEQRKGTAS